jgi:hypothetical protein
MLCKCWNKNQRKETEMKAEIIMIYMNTVLPVAGAGSFRGGFCPVSFMRANTPIRKDRIDSYPCFQPDF